MPEEPGLPSSGTEALLPTLAINNRAHSTVRHEKFQSG
jgi:hypothetical protein